MFDYLLLLLVLFISTTSSLPSLPTSRPSSTTSQTQFDLFKNTDDTFGPNNSLPDLSNATLLSNYTDESGTAIDFHQHGNLYVGSISSPAAVRAVVGNRTILATRPKDSAFLESDFDVAIKYLILYLMGYVDYYFTKSKLTSMSIPILVYKLVRQSKWWVGWGRLMRDSSSASPIMVFAWIDPLSYIFLLHEVGGLNDYPRMFCFGLAALQYLATIAAVYTQSKPHVNYDPVDPSANITTAYGNISASDVTSNPAFFSDPYSTHGTTRSIVILSIGFLFFASAAAFIHRDASQNEMHEGNLKKGHPKEVWGMLLMLLGFSLAVTLLPYSFKSGASTSLFQHYPVVVWPDLGIAHIMMAQKLPKYFDVKLRQGWRIFDQVLGL